MRERLSNLDARTFHAEKLVHGEQTLELLSLEADCVCDERITPPDWEERVAAAIANADMTFMEYFPPELEANVPYLRKMESFSGNVFNVYDKIATMAYAQGKEVAVADIANKALYEAYHAGTPALVGAAALAYAQGGGPLAKPVLFAGEAYIASMVYQAARRKGTYGAQPGLLERLTPNLNDARRVLTARAIAQTAADLPAQSSLLYIAAPAHTARVKTMLTNPKRAMDSAKAVLYKGFVGLDRSTRVYTPVAEGWELTSVTPVR